MRKKDMILNVLNNFYLNKYGNSIIIVHYDRHVFKIFFINLKMKKKKKFWVTQTLLIRSFNPGSAFTSINVALSKSCYFTSILMAIVWFLKTVDQSRKKLLSLIQYFLSESCQRCEKIIWVNYHEIPLLLVAVIDNTSYMLDLLSFSVSSLSSTSDLFTCWGEGELLNGNNKNFYFEI